MLEFQSIDDFWYGAFELKVFPKRLIVDGFMYFKISELNGNLTYYCESENHYIEYNTSGKRTIHTYYKID